MKLRGKFKNVEFQDTKIEEADFELELSVKELVQIITSKSAEAIMDLYKEIKPMFNKTK